MMMRMLAHGGAPILTDGRRPPDEDNPRGYFELEAVKASGGDAAWAHHAVGRCVKVISFLLPHLPVTLDYRVVFMRRDIDQVMRSQRAMLARRGLAPTAEDEPTARRSLADHLAEIEAWLERASHMRVLGVSYEAVLARPDAELSRILDFLRLDLDHAAMRNAIEPALQRQR